VAPWTAASQED